MTDLNHVAIIGRLTRDPDGISYMPNGNAVLKFSIAVNRRKKTGDQWTEEASYFDVTLFGKSAESLKQYLVKGKQVAVDGELRQDRWEKDGQKNSKVYIVANNVQLLGGNQSGSGASAGGYSSGSYNSGSYGNNAYQPRQTAPSAPQNEYDQSMSYGGDSGFPEDIPF